VFAKIRLERTLKTGVVSLLAYTLPKPMTPEEIASWAASFLHGWAVTHFGSPVKEGKTPQDPSTGGDTLQAP
jgi:hypothetical protein